jgi:cyclohexanecarboxylate-CoA ligase
LKLGRAGPRWKPALPHEHPVVHDVAVVAVPDPGTGEKACAVVVCVPGQTVTLRQLCQYLELRNVARQKLPEQLELFDALPITAAGKVQKFILREQLRARLDESGDSVALS